MLAWMPGFLSLPLWCSPMPPTQAGGGLCQNLSKIARREDEEARRNARGHREEGRGKVVEKKGESMSNFTRRKSAFTRMHYCINSSGFPGVGCSKSCGH